MMSNNAINVIKPYKWNGMWVFDDGRVNLDKEPFVAGADTMIDKAIDLKGIQNADQGFLLVFSEFPFPDADFEVTWDREESAGNIYKWRLDEGGEAVVGQRRRVAEHLVENVRLLQVIEVFPSPYKGRDRELAVGQ